ncbi:MAG TPA: glycosyltransferase family 39 protein [Chthoniobacterales bacterium]
MSPLPGSPPVSMVVSLSGLALLYCMAAAMVVLLGISNRGYGFHRDELATLDDARHLAWGYVAYPPVTPFFGWLSLHLFGESLPGFRFFATLATATGTLITGLMARQLGGGQAAQLLAAGATLFFGLAAGSLMQYVAFDYLCWILVAYFFVRLLQSDDARWWVAIGGAIGLGMLTKYSMLFCVAGLAGAFLVGGRWRDLTSRWFWLGVLLSFLIFLPNLIWQMRNGFISLEFLRHIHERDIRIGRTRDFLPDQLKITLFAFPLALAGLCFFFVARAGRRFRAVGLIYLVALVLFVLARGRGYYLAPAYPLLYAGGAVLLERWVANWRRAASIGGWSPASIAVCANVVLVMMLVMPLAPVGTPWGKKALSTNGDLAEEIGWPELVEAVAAVRDSIPAEERSRLGILVGNYGEGGAINLYGPRFDLPSAIGGVNSFWARGYWDPPPATLIVIGLSREFLERNFESCEVAGQVSNRYGVLNEETREHPDIFVCRRLRLPWDEFWKAFRHYG